LDVNEKIRKMMEDRGWSAYRLTEESGLSNSTISNLFKRKNTPTLNTLESICRAFGMSLHEFFGGENFYRDEEERELLRCWMGLKKEQKVLIMEMIKSFKK